MSNNKHYKSITVIALAMGFTGASSAWAVDNRVPSFWGSVSIKVVETYGNNNTKPLTGAQVILDLKNPEKAVDVLKKYPVIEFPMTSTSQKREVTFTRIPPSAEVGEYTIKVIPKPFDRNNRYNCEPYPQKTSFSIGPKGEVTENFIKPPGPMTTRRTYGYKCSMAGNNRNFYRTKARNDAGDSECHKVRVQGLGAAARYGYVMLKACKETDGKWKIDPYEYRR